ncbi:G-protein coupled receptors family 1 profile domain-containing protein [Caenorhabditis elegans]|uniref:G-protein coupled receptors family 1 profile domain-containing protein n=1 Tax=Caenorhabditis elegans TaxID=6239 RepID=A0A1X7RBN0_CAEEL|nr:G-protein coupled receptors family 1 profile domain-containing protein [Caenorhabditis elegans]SMQ11467.1 G-protein coupled receptors family 1 profile domain-containing protein [Caenorhabditis elegans]|eukprot:NP_001338831.1 Uncharacterized protein CELE_B0244.17 [Caenorhabditis elegans]
MGNLFENCTHRYSFEYIYENCTNTTNQCGLIRNVASSIDVFHWLDVYISTTIFVISGILNFYCLFIALYTYYFLDNETRKHYVFVLSRFLSSILVIISLLVLESTLFSESLSPTFAYYAVAFSIYDFSMDTLFFSYIMISLITYFGVVHYNFYRRHVSLRSLYIILISMWTFSLAIAIPLGLYEAASNSQGPIKCDLSYCGKVVEWITFSIACISLAITASLTGFAVISLHWYNYKSKTNGVDVPKVTTRARIRLTWTFFALIVICLIELLPFGLVIGNDKSSLQGCDSFYNANELLVQSIISSVETLVGSLVFLTDPLINIFFDKNISKMVKLQITYLRSKLCRNPPPTKF